MSIFWFLAATAIRAFFALSRGALINMRRSRLVELEQRGVTSAIALQRLSDNSSQLLATAEVGSIFSLVIAAGIAVADFVPHTLLWVQSWQLEWLPEAAAQVIAYILVVFGASMFLFIFGRLVPEALAVRNPEPMALALVRPMQFSSFVLSPVVRLAVAISNLLSMPLGGQKRDSASLVTQEELKTMVDAGEEEGLIEEDEKEMILSVLDFGDTLAREVMVPRIDITAVEVNTSIKEVTDLIITSGHSRLPIYRETIDDIVGFLYVKDILKALHEDSEPPLAKLARPAYYTVESKKVSELLQEMQNRRVHACIVVDEYGGTAGMVTIEDILEEIVGDIQDEYDTEEPEVQLLPDNAGYIFDAGIDIDDVNDLLHVELPTDQSDTLGGFIYDQIGEVPEKGATVQFARLLFTVLEVNDRRILKVEVTHEPEESAQSDENENGVKTQDKDAAERPTNGRNTNGRANGRTANA